MSLKYLTNILVIEDNPGDQELLKILLNEAGLKHELWFSKTLSAGFDVLQSSEIDVVLLDLSLPDSSGFKTLTAYQQKYAHVPVIVLTGTNNEIVGNQSIKAGAQDYLVKGNFEAKILSRVIRYALQRHAIQHKLEETAEQLEVSERRLKDAQNLAQVANWEMDLVNFSMFWSEQLFTFFGLRPNSVTPSLSEYLKAVYPDDRPDVDAFFNAASSTADIQQVEHRVLVDGKRKKEVIARAQLKVDPQTGKLLLAGTVQDISNQKQDQHQLLENKMNNQVARIRDEALVELSFQTRTPLSSALNLVYLIEQTEQQPKEQELVNMLKTSLEDLSVSVHNLLNYSVLLSDHLELDKLEFSIPALVQSLEKTLKPKFARAGKNLVVQMGDSLPQRLKADDKKILMVCTNLLEYALKFGTPTQQVDLSVNMKQSVQPTNTLDFAFNWELKSDDAQNLEWLLSSADLERELLQQDTNKIKPEYIGLFIARKLLDVLGGNYVLKIQKQSVNLQVHIPVNTVVQLAVNPEQAPTSPLRILMFEDHMLNQIATKKLLKSWSSLVSVDVAANGKIGIDLFAANHYDLVLMDIQMPVMGGLEATKALREQSGVPIIALTAQSTAQERQECFDVGMNDYLSKPFKPADLFTTINKAISMASSAN